LRTEPADAEARRGGREGYFGREEDALLEEEEEASRWEERKSEKRSRRKKSEEQMECQLFPLSNDRF
jgi:hypothetical protein